MILHYCTALLDCPNTAVGLYIKCHTGVAVGISTRINTVFRCWHLRSRLQFFLNVHNGSLNMLNDSINRQFTGLLGYDTALTLRKQDNLFRAFGVVCLLFFKIMLKNLSGALSECQAIRIQLRTDVLTVLNWAQTVCKGYKQTAKVAISRQKVNVSIMLVSPVGRVFNTNRH